METATHSEFHAFLEQEPLFSRKKVSIPEDFLDLHEENLILKCPKCGKTSEFSFIYYQYTDGFPDYLPPGGRKISLLYQCLDCQKGDINILLYISPEKDYIMKFGQYPKPN
jgi:DNA-directed RNA polymerase subunit RPC12/RpoP